MKLNAKLKQMPLWRDANHLLLLIEDAVRQFPRGVKDSHKCVGEIKGYWSASPYAGNAANAWNVNFNNGNDNINNKSNTNNVRLVRAGEWRA